MLRDVITTLVTFHTDTIPAMGARATGTTWDAWRLELSTQIPASAAADPDAELLSDGTNFALGTPIVLRNIAVSGPTGPEAIRADLAIFATGTIVFSIPVRETEATSAANAKQNLGAKVPELLKALAPINLRIAEALARLERGASNTAPRSIRAPEHQDTFFLELRARNQPEVCYAWASIDGESAWAFLSSYDLCITMLWLRHFLDSNANDLERSLLLRQGPPKGTTDFIKQLHLTSKRIVSAAHPMAINVTEAKMATALACRTAWRIDELTSILDGQAQVLDEITEWMEHSGRERTNLRIGMVATILSILSISAVAAQIVSTIDFDNTTSKSWRIALIAFGTLGAVALLGAGFALGGAVRKPRHHRTPY